jgi:excisionase family DNA binding protein
LTRPASTSQLQRCPECAELGLHADSWWWGARPRICTLCGHFEATFTNPTETPPGDLDTERRTDPLAAIVERGLAARKARERLTETDKSNIITSLDLDHMERPEATRPTTRADGNAEVESRRQLPDPLHRADGVRVYPLPAVANFVGLSPERLRQLVAEGRLAFVRPGKDIYVSVEDVQAYLATPRRPGPTPLPSRAPRRRTSRTD